MPDPRDDAFEPDERRPSKRRRDEEEEDYDDEPRRRRRRPRPRDNDALSSLIPYKNGMALAAYYCGVFGLIPLLGAVLGPLALFLGIAGLKYVKNYPEAKGTGHAITGIVLGALELFAHLVIGGFVVMSIMTRH